MLRLVLLLHLVLCSLVMCKRRKEKESSESADDLGGQLVTALRNDVNIDLSADEEYEDLRAELLAYHTALASITPGRSKYNTMCVEQTKSTLHCKTLVLIILREPLLIRP